MDLSQHGHLPCHDIQSLEHIAASMTVHRAQAPIGDDRIINPPDKSLIDGQSLNDPVHRRRGDQSFPNRQSLGRQSLAGHRICITKHIRKIGDPSLDIGRESSTGSKLLLSLDPLIHIIDHLLAQHGR